MVSSTGPVSPVPPALPPQLRPALLLLLQAWDYAAERKSDPWDFAVRVADLRVLGLTMNDLRWLSDKGYVHNAVERTEPTEKRRVFGPPDPAVITEKSGFVLTATGADAIRQLHPEAVSVQPTLPVYDRDRRELWLGEQLVKRFKQRAPDQHAILSAFQELGWPRKIDDPLPSKHPGSDRKLRLRNAITRLNWRQQHPLIRFRGDGTGQGILWESTAARDA